MQEKCLQTLKANGRRVEKARGEVIYRAGDQPLGLYYLERGLVGLSLIGNEGQEHLVRLFRSGMPFGHRSLLANKTYHATSICLEKSEFYFVPKDKVFELLRSAPDFSMGLIEILADELGRAEQKLVSMTDKDVISRIAETLVYLKELRPDYHWTRQEIADFCGSTGPTVIRALGRLEERGLIRQVGREIQLVDRAALLALG